MKESFDFILENYEYAPKLVNNQDSVYIELVNKLPKEIRGIINRPELKVKGSMGQGNKSDSPWIAILNPNITLTTQMGLYIVFLFKKDMSGFYLTLNQGIKNFQDLYQSKKYEYAAKVTSYFKDNIPETTFSKNEISLGNVKPGQRAYGYEKTTILSKFYPIKQYTDEILKQDLFEIVHIYDKVARHFNTSSYNEVIKQILAADSPIVVDGDKAIQAIKNFVDPDNEAPFGYRKQMVEQKPFVDLSKNFKRLTNPTVGKIDYVKKAYRDMKTGLVGEQLVIDYEKEKLISLNREDLADKVKWISRDSDSYGYDIESYDVDNQGKVIPLKIEVKTTSSRIDVEFFISKNEVDASKKYKKNYVVFRLYDVYSEQPKFYRAYGEVSDNFILDPVTFMARYKFTQVINN